MFSLFIECPQYCVQRHLLTQNIDALRLSIPFPLQLVFNGDISLTYKQNIEIFKYVHELIQSTKRFE